MSRKTIFRIVLYIFCFLVAIDFVSLAKPTLSQTPPNTCIQGYVWREAFPNDHVCVTPEVRSQTADDNSQAAARIDPVNQTYGPDTCIQGYVWREAIPSDHVCVTPGIRSQTADDNSQAASRVIVQAPVRLDRVRTPVRLDEVRTPVRLDRVRIPVRLDEVRTTIPPKPSPPQFLGVSTDEKQEALSIALNDASHSLGGGYANAANDLLYKIISQDSGINGTTWVSWVIIELESNPDYHPQIDCPQPEYPPNYSGERIGKSCDPLPSACYFRDPRNCPRR